MAANKQSVKKPSPILFFGIVAVLFFLAAFSSRAALVTIVSHGSVSNRLNIVVLAEGYTSAQTNLFLDHATNAVKSLLSQAPFSEYSNYFNAFAIPVASAQSGSDHLGSPFRDTYFNSIYEPPSDILISIPPNFTNANYNDGMGKIDALLLANLPQCNLPILLVNDGTAGGSDGGGGGTVAIVSRSPSAAVFIPHEAGHVLANLGDEYTFSYPGFPDIEEPNTTTNSNATKWNAWILPGTPLPTPPTAPNATLVGSFEGAHYHTTGWYRPQLNCAMKNQGSPFCAVCTEALVLAFYKHARPVDQWLPVATNLTLTSTQAVTFTVTPLQPSTHNLSIQWRTNGTSVTGATNTSFIVHPAAFSNGTYVVRADVQDTTTLVRTDPGNLRSQSVSWTMNINITEIRLDSAAMNSGGKFIFRVSGHAPAGAVIQRSTNLVQWIPVKTNGLTNGSFFYYTNDPLTGSSPAFFRGKTPP